MTEERIETILDYHFSVGNSTDGPVGMCMSVYARSKAEAVILGNKFLDDNRHEIKVRVQPGVHVAPPDPIAYCNVYLNGALTEADIDGIWDEDGQATDYTEAGAW